MDPEPSYNFQSISFGLCLNTASCRPFDIGQNPNPSKLSKNSQNFNGCKKELGWEEHL